MRIVLLGAPGAGKGTHCKRIVQRYGLVHLSSGDILRNERAKGSRLGKEAESYMDSGGLVPDELIVKMMADAIAETSASGFVLDGFPRTVNQASELDRALASSGQKLDMVLNLNVDEEVIFERMTGRRSCPKCGVVYHVKNLKPKVDRICDKDGTELIRRPDDSLEVVKNRLEAYHEQTELVVDYYKENGKVCQIDANGSPDEVAAVIFSELDALVSA